MRLVNCGAGELTDRLTILALKILSGGEAGKDTAHFETERTALLAQIRSRTLNGKWFASVLELGAVNAMLWQAEDDLRGWRAPRLPYSPADLEAIRVVAFRIQDLNDRRAALVAEINKDAGDGEQKEKL